MRYFLVSLLMALTSWCHAAEFTKLNEGAGTQVVVLIGGIGDDYRYFAPWMNKLAEAHLPVFGYGQDYRATRMEVAAIDLATQLTQLREKGVSSVILLAHSMGGLVAKRALHAMGSAETSRFTSIELRTYGTPFGGFFLANFARWLPGSAAIAGLLGVPMGLEIGSTSEFMEGMQMPMPAHTRLVVTDSSADTVATPQAASSVQRYNAVLSVAAEVRRLESAGHDDFVNFVSFEL